ncbi:MAG TPA: DNA mismatch repair protein [Coriobacteriia bacterium]|nr:MAG: ATP-binding region ATPase domain protein [Actinobacteria bacterium 66_15]HAL29240.1 DNA mismatch repair protein [Coriobacteriia bacterium]
MNNRRDRFTFEISLSVLNHLGRNLYRNFITVLGEAISNAWDADAKNVWIQVDREDSSFGIADDGIGMDAEDFQSKFLKIGYSKRADGGVKSPSGRPYIGAKGIGKLALLSCAERISVFTRKTGHEYVGGRIDNSGLDAAIKNDLTPDGYPLEKLDFDLLKRYAPNHEHGTVIVFEDTKIPLRNTVTYIRKMLAMSFRFSLFDKDFAIIVNGVEISIDDLRDLGENTQFLWVIEDYRDEYTAALNHLGSDPIAVSAKLDICGFIASVKKPRDLKIPGTDERATIDLFVNGRLREKNILRHIPSQRLVESYLYGQVHFDSMDSGGADPFTSSREGIIEGNEEFKSLLGYMKPALNKIFDDWDRLRLDVGETGDEENKRKGKKERRARDLYAAAREEYKPDDDTPTKDQVDAWLDGLRDDAEFNVSAYVDCFLSENLVRKYLSERKIELTDRARNGARDHRGTEAERLRVANISFEINQTDDDLGYLGMDDLAHCAEGHRNPTGQSLFADAVSYKPVRDAVGHTRLLTENAKTHLSLRYENIRGRVRRLISQRSDET